MTSIKTEYANLEVHQRPIVGDLKMSVVNVDHIGWLICDGRSVSVNDFLFLFNVIGHSFGGSGSNFNLPNPAGRILGVLGQGRDANPTLSTTTFTLGGNYGEYNHLLTIAEIPSHNHDIVYASTNTWGIGTSSLTGFAGSHNHSASTFTAGLHNHGGLTGTVDMTPNNIITGLSYTNNGLGLAGSANVVTNNSSATLSPDPHQHTIADDGNHVHGISTQIDHQHEIWAEGGSQYHNNIQPTIGLGNMFIYSGLPTYPTIFRQSYSGWPGFFQGNPDGVYLPNPPLQ